MKLTKEQKAGTYYKTLSRGQLIEVIEALLLLIKGSKERANQLRELLILEKEPIKTPAEIETAARMAGLFKRPRKQ